MQDLYYLYFSGLLIGSFFTTYFIIPRIINVVTYKRLMENPNHRSSHIKKVPSLGGIAFYIVIVLGIYFLEIWDKTNNSISLIPGLLILFIIGLKDDLIVLSPFTKIGAELLAIIFILQHPDFQILSLHGFLGIENIALYISLPLSAFIMLAIINAFNLIDGIDGLASVVGIIIFGVIGAFFYVLHLYFFFGISLIMTGSLSAFLRFNISSKKKIFMGGTGSLIIGFVIAFQVIRLFAVPSFHLQQLPFLLENLPLVVMAILIVPIFDTARVFTIRIINKKGPFSPDRNHIHHLLIDYLSLSHRRASFFIGVFNILFIAGVVFLATKITHLYLIGVLFFFILCLIYFFYRINLSFNNLRRKLWLQKKIKKFKTKA